MKVFLFFFLFFIVFSSASEEYEAKVLAEDLIESIRPPADDDYGVVANVAAADNSSQTDVASSAPVEPSLLRHRGHPRYTFLYVYQPIYVPDGADEPEPNPLAIPFAQAAMFLSDSPELSAWAASRRVAVSALWRVLELDALGGAADAAEQDGPGDVDEVDYLGRLERTFDELVRAFPHVNLTLPEPLPDAFILMLHRPEPDRKCLLTPPPKVNVAFVDILDQLLDTPPPTAETMMTVCMGIDDVLCGFVRKINEMTGSSLTVRGHLTMEAAEVLRRESALYRPNADDEPIDDLDVWADSAAEAGSAAAEEDVLNRYVLAQRPVRLVGAARHWPALTKWSRAALEAAVGDKPVTAKVGVADAFEGSEPLAPWLESLGGAAEPPPARVVRRLADPDVVVARPAAAPLPVSQLLAYVFNDAQHAHNLSFYLEYTALSNFPELQADVSPPALLDRIFNRPAHQAHPDWEALTNVWIGDGRTTAKLHFDPHCNVMCVVRGAKTFTVFAPHANEQLYEGHLREATLGWTPDRPYEVRHQALEDATAMVMSPITDVRRPNLTRFPRFAGARPQTVRIDAGDCLYLPAWWWHEVQSEPDAAEPWSVAVNFWWTPVFQKKFPCALCDRTFNKQVYQDFFE